MTDLERAKTLLADHGLTLALCKGDVTHTDTRRGVVPLLGLLDDGTDIDGFSAADKVVGKAAAFLYLRLGVSRLYAGVISRSAYDLLTAHGVETTYGEMTSAIRNRAGDGYCPMEQVCLEHTDPLEAEKAIRTRLVELLKNKN